MCLRLRFQRYLAAACILAGALVVVGCGLEDDVIDIPIVTFTNLNDGDAVTSPVNVCLETSGIDIVASGVLQEGTGHHHLIVNPSADEHTMYTEPGNVIPVDVEPRYVHLGDGSSCTDIDLAPGEHTLLAIVANGGHVTLDPAVHEDVTINVE